MKKMMCALILASVFALVNVDESRAEGRELGMNVTYADRYIWRGMPLNEEAVLQPSINLSGGGFLLNVWGNLDLTDWGEDAGYGDEQGNVTEIDYSGAYEHSFGPLTLGVGFANYTFPHVALSPTTEIFVSAALDVPMSPSITVYVDEVSEGANYNSLDLGHSFELGESGGVGVALDLFAHAGWANDKFVEVYYVSIDDGAWHDWSAGAALPISLPLNFTLTPSYSYTSLWDEDIRDVVDDEWELDPESGVFMIDLAWAFEF